jgi:hypothetical protein
MAADKSQPPTPASPFAVREVPEQLELELQQLVSEALLSAQLQRERLKFLPSLRPSEPVQALWPQAALAAALQLPSAA